MFQLLVSRISGLMGAPFVFFRDSLLRGQVRTSMSTVPMKFLTLKRTQVQFPENFQASEKVVIKVEFWKSSTSEE